jgi:hypothetical protein
VVEVCSKLLTDRAKIGGSLVEAWKSGQRLKVLWKFGQGLLKFLASKLEKFSYKLAKKSGQSSLKANQSFVEVWSKLAEKLVKVWSDYCQSSLSLVKVCWNCVKVVKVCSKLLTDRAKIGGSLVKAWKSGQRLKVL